MKVTPSTIGYKPIQITIETEDEYTFLIFLMEKGLYNTSNPEVLSMGQELLKQLKQSQE